MKEKKIIFIFKFILLIQLVFGQTFFDGINRTYDATNNKMNHVFVNYDQKADGSQQYVPLGAFYFKNTVTASESVIEDKQNGLGYIAMTPDVIYKVLLI